MKDKEYGVKLTVDISSYKESLNKAIELTKKTKRQIEEPLRKVKVSQDGKNYDIKIGANTSKIDKQLKETAEEFEKRMANVKPKIHDWINNSRDTEDTSSLEDRKFWKMFSNMKGPARNIDITQDELEKGVKELFGETEKLDNGIKKTTEDTKNLGRAVEETKNKATGIIAIFSRFSNDIPKSINKGVNSIKRFTLSLLGIRGVYTMLTRASNAYMSQDEELHTRLQANWIALGAMFAPIIEKLIVLFQKLVAYVNVFWKALTGKNLIEQALKKVEKSSQKTTKAVKELNKELANIDEIVNLNFDQGTNNLGDTDNNFGIPDALKEIENLQLNPKIVEIINNIAKKLLEAWDWCNKVKDKLNEWGIPLGNVVKLIGVIFGATEVGRIVSGISKIIGVSGGTTGIYGMITALSIVDAYLGKTLYDKVKELKTVWEQQALAEERLGNSRIKTLSITYDQVVEIDKLLEQGITTDKHGNDLVGKKEGLIEQAKDTYIMFNKELNSGVRYSKAQVAEMEEMKKRLENLTKEKWEINAEVDFKPTNDTRNWWDKLIDNIRGTLVKPTGGGTGKHFAKGNVAYQPTVAEFGEYAGARSNPEITAPQSMIRETLSQALADVLPLVNNQSGDTILYVNGRELARATYSDFKAESNRLGSSNVAIRRG